EPAAVPTAALPGTLALAVGAGAHDDAAALLPVALGALPALAPAIRGLVVTLAIEHLVAVGERPRAVALANEHRVELAGSRPGATWLGHLGLAATALHTPDRRLDATAVDRRIEAGDLDH